MLLRALLAAFMGTAAMTLSSQTEQMLRERPSSSTPGMVGAKILSLFGIKELSDKSISLIGTWMHWIYGTSWGFVLWFLFLFNLSPTAVFILYYVLVWLGQQIFLPAMGVAQPTWKYGSTEIIVDLWHHFIYALFTVIAFSLIGQAA